MLDDNPTIQRLLRVFRLWFGFRSSVGRRVYVASFLLLTGVKLIGELALSSRLGPEPLTLFQALSPFWGHRINAATAQPFNLSLLLAWSLPFLWVGASMTARRARDAGLSPLLALVLFIPVLNALMILVLCLVRSVDEETAVIRNRYDDPRFFLHPLRAAMAGALAGGAVLTVALSHLGGGYGLGLFVVAPVVIGLVTGIVFNRTGRRAGSSTQGVVQLALLASAGSLLLLGVEGVLCLAMAYPLALPLAAIGGLVGRTIARPRQLGTSQLVLLVVAAPFLTGLDRLEPEPPAREILTTVTIDAPPKAVWPHVVDFAELPPPNALAFRLGIAYPTRARIVGTGVGAVRYCEFSTGAFVEPITHWEPPHRLAFDVADQPPTMQEWSPYSIHPPHLTESLHSERGEFRLVPLDDGRTRLEGRTWYRHELAPHAYWNLWSDALIHRIHRRVLGFVAARSEAAHTRLPPSTPDAETRHDLHPLDQQG